MAMVQVKIRGLAHSNEFITLDDADLLKVSAYKWYVDTSGYALGYSKGRYVRMHRLLINAPKGLEVDHINGNRLDNRRANLRIVSKQQNSWNRKLHRDNTSGYRGVCYIPARNKWVANLRVNGRQVFLGRYATAKEAAVAYNEAAKQHRGVFAALNVLN